MLPKIANIAGQAILSFMAGLMLADVITGKAIIPVFSAILFTFALFFIAFASFSARLYIYGFGALFGGFCWFAIGILSW